MRRALEKAYRALVQRAEHSRIVWLLLSPLIVVSALFWVISSIRRFFFMALRKKRTLSSVVITVGNVTVGGTGKTPMILSLLSGLDTKKTKIAYVSRGYRREGRGLCVGRDLDPKQIGDEASLVQRRHKEVVVGICSSKWKAARMVDSQVDLIILDDGLQRYDVPVDVEVATVDCLCPDGFGYLLPRGLLRESFSRLREVDALVLTNAIDTKALERGLEKVKGFNLPIIITRPRITQFFTPDGLSCTLAPSTPVALVCSIAHPKRFRLTMQKAGYTVVEQMELPDHVDIKDEELVQWADRIRVLYEGVVVVGTEKDWARKSTWPALSVPLLFSRLESEIVEGKENFCALIDRVHTMVRTKPVN